MEYSFSFDSFVTGLIITIIGVAFMGLHRKIADAIGSGVMSYDKFKLYALITTIIGIVVCLNLHWFIFSNLIGSLFRIKT